MVNHVACRVMRYQDGWIQVAAPAKINVFLEVLGRRPDGFHDLLTLMVCIGLFDTIEMARCDARTVELSCRAWDGRPAEPVDTNAEYSGAEFSDGHRCGFEDIPDREGNLVWQVLDAFQRRTGVRRGARVTLTKRIPSRAGLGGGSSDAAAALWAANRIWEVNWSVEELARFAADFGSDIPFFFSPGAAVCRGRGEQVESIEALGGVWLVLVRPPAGLTTATVFKRCHPSPNPDDVGPMVHAVRAGSSRDVGRLLVNRLEPTARELCPWVQRVDDVFSKQECLGHQMSGSGTSYFGICCHARHARRVAARLRNQRLGFVTAVKTLAAGPRQAERVSES